MCPLCNGRRSLQHILSSCPKAPQEAGYRWRHNEVLRTIAMAVEKATQENKYQLERKINCESWMEMEVGSKKEIERVLNTATD